MEKVSILLEPSVLRFYMCLAKCVQLPVEQVLSDALFKLAGELSLEALQQNNFEKRL